MLMMRRNETAKNREQVVDRSKYDRFVESLGKKYWSGYKKHRGIGVMNENGRIVKRASRGWRR